VLPTSSMRRSTTSASTWNLERLEGLAAQAAALFFTRCQQLGVAGELQAASQVQYFGGTPFQPARALLLSGQDGLATCTLQHSFKKESLLGMQVARTSHSSTYVAARIQMG
jgi:hypothetical protein